ncbi:hypothetical protein [Paracoccus sp. IB05]|uniref:hypothetical protein n=1 Tax=Paracoccus sp. IB05 TaxID=2779367 RepID=UPI0018E860FA|nr:hypothetical protein [Paracoccus sp. IB05]MBJ2150178.1 hypothetical protein [Paracoccus sp. IB05]
MERSEPAFGFTTPFRGSKVWAKAPPAALIASVAAIRNLIIFNLHLHDPGTGFRICDKEDWLRMWFASSRPTDPALRQDIRLIIRDDNRPGQDLTFIVRGSFYHCLRREQVCGEE